MELLETIEPICVSLMSAATLQEKHDVLEKLPVVNDFLNSSPELISLLNKFNLKELVSFKAFLALGQGPNAFQGVKDLNELQKRLPAFIKLLCDLERFYDRIGGIVGYQLTVLKLILAQDEKRAGNQERIRYEEPEGIDLKEDTPEVKQAIAWGIEALTKIAEIYPVGGAGDRLQLQDEGTGEPLPAAKLLFCGKTLLEGLVRDLQGREFLYYKLFSQQPVVPIALMTSHEKNNHLHILEILESNGWFGRDKTGYKLFTQLLVPMVTIEGNWAMHGPLEPILKPGGHGVIWKQAQDEGIFDWLERKGCRKAIIRQINNPVAGIDKGLLALAGIGSHLNKDFGFASCYRLLNTAEGVDVLREKKLTNGYQYCITNVEYTEFEKLGIADAPVEQGSPYSRFPSNTNILFADLQAVKKALLTCQIPGMLINMKTSVSCYQNGNFVEKKAGRLESIMQNIADEMVDELPHPLKPEERRNLRTFLTFNERSKTISVAKQAYSPGKSFLGTPEGCFHELMKNYRDLLENACGMELPPENDLEEYLKVGPSFVALFHPSIGPLYSIIAQKVRGGWMAKGAELILEVAEVDILNLNLEGSLIVEAENVMGKKDAHGIIRYHSSDCGKCTLLNVAVKNSGIDDAQPNIAWKRQVNRSEACHIFLHGNAEFFAEDVTLEGNMQFEVPNGHRLVMYHRGDELDWHFEKINHSTWEWSYSVDEQENIYLDKELKSS